MEGRYIGVDSPSHHTKHDAKQCAVARVGGIRITPRNNSLSFDIKCQCLVPVTVTPNPRMQTDSLFCPGIIIVHPENLWEELFSSSGENVVRLVEKLTIMKG